MLAAVLAGWGLVDLAIAIVIVAAVVALVWVGVRAMGVSIPGWVQQVLWIVAIAVVVVVAIKIVAGL